MSLGWVQALPLELGGDPSSTEAAYKALRSMLGKNGVAVSEDGIDGLELACEAMGLAAISAFDERAALQAFPSLAIDAIAWFEDILLIKPDPAATEQDRRVAAALAWVQVFSSEIPTLEQELKTVDTRFRVLDTAWANSKTTIFGRAFQPGVTSTEQPPFDPDGSKPFSDWPKYSSRDIVVALLDIGTGTSLTAEELRIHAAGRRLMRNAIPAWNEAVVITEIGLTAGESPVGFAGVTGGA